MRNTDESLSTCLFVAGLIMVVQSLKVPFVVVAPLVDSQQKETSISK